jgi:hypothetical protein
MRAYHESEWAVRRWDWFNGGRIVEPLSFCQFWRTVLFYVPIRCLLMPFLMVSRAAATITAPGLPMAGLRGQASSLSFKGCKFAALSIGRVLWFLAYPLRWVLPPVGRTTLAGIVGIGEPVVAWRNRHQERLGDLGVSAAVICLIAATIFIVVVLLLQTSSWTLTTWLCVLAGIGGSIVALFAGYGLYKSGLLPLIWQAAVAAKHGVCPPVDIVRESVEDAAR